MPPVMERSWERSWENSWELTVARHGQASAHAEDYDVLSSLGMAQSRMLGAHLARAGAVFDAIVAGPRKRQIDTARHAVLAAREAGASWPEPVTVDAFDEIPLREILAAWLPLVIDEDPVARALHERVHGRHSVEEVTRVLMRAMLSWARDEVTLEGVEAGSFATFRDRFADAARALRRHGGRVLLCTSAGPVAVALHLCGDPRATDGPSAMRYAMRVPNASVTRVRWNGEQPLLVEASSTAHLRQEDVTFI
jgi:broad specificity phosphatase PhoE